MTVTWQLYTAAAACLVKHNSAFLVRPLCFTGCTLLGFTSDGESLLSYTSSGVYKLQVSFHKVFPHFSKGLALQHV